MGQDGHQEYFAVYARRSRMVKFARLTTSPFERSAHGQLKRSAAKAASSLGVGVLILLGTLVSDQPSNATETEQAYVVAAEVSSDPVLDQWAEFFENALPCRSSIDGSNASLVHLVKDHMARPTTFLHLATTFWPQGEAGYPVDMIYRVGGGKTDMQIRQVSAAVDPVTCEAGLISI